MPAIAEDLHRQMEHLLRRVITGEASPAVLKHAAEIAMGVHDFAAMAVRQARGRKESWATIAQATNLSPDSARRRWSADRTARRMEQRRQRTRTTDGSVIGHEGGARPATGAVFIPAQRAAARRAPGSGDTRAVPEAGPSGARPGEPLARALSYLQRSCGKPLRALGEEADVSASYISRVLSGERCPSWKVARQITASCNGDPADIRPLWDTARNSRYPTRTAPDTRTFHAALRGLHLSAACPDPSAIRISSHGLLSLDDITALLHGSDIPDWSTVDRFVYALHGRPADIRPLWDAAHTSSITPTPKPDRFAGPWRAESFG